MSILDALLSETVLQASLAMLASGASIVPVTGKQASVAWARFQGERATVPLVQWWYGKNLLQGAAVVLGAISHGLVCVDCDGDSAVQEYEATFPHLLNTLTVISGSGHGKHYYYRAIGQVVTTRTRGWELRSDGCYVVIPPSRHPDTGNRYRVEHYTEPAMMTDCLSGVRAWIEDKTRAQVVSVRRESGTTSAPAPSGRIKNPQSYARAALNRECDAVARASVGRRNTTLSLAACKLGNLVQLGWIQRGDVESALQAAAAGLATDEGESSVVRTITSGIDAGMKLNARN